MPERTLEDMFQIMKQGVICDYIRSGAEMPHKHTEADPKMRAEVSVYMQFQLFLYIRLLIFVSLISCV